MNREGSPFDRRVVVAVVIAGVLAFAAFLWLSGYAPAVRRFDTTGFAPLSKNAVGFAGTFKLIKDVTGEAVEVLEGDQAYDEPGLLIMPLATDTDPVALRAFAEQRADNIEAGATLFILPKWETRPIPSWTSDWVQSTGLIDRATVDRLSNALAGVKVEHLPGRGRALAGLVDATRALPQTTVVLPTKPTLIPMLSLDGEQAILVRVTDIPGGTTYLLSDPDLLANLALKTRAGAETALAIVEAVRPLHERQITTDPEPARGAAPQRERNLLQLMFEPPFLAITLSILAAALLAALHAFGRFGPALPEPRAIPFGKRALADNTAVLFGRAGAVGRLGERYIALTRDAVAHRLGAGQLPPAALEAWLAKLPGVRGRDFAALAADLRAAQGADAVRAGAAALHDWKNEVMRDR